jgi:ribonuclease HI
MSERTQITLSVKGACVENPGPGGYAAVLLSGERRKEITGCRRLTTNNRMELMAAKAGLETLKWPCHVTVRSESRYLVDGGNERQTRRWQVNRNSSAATGWLRPKRGGKSCQRTQVMGRSLLGIPSSSPCLTEGWPNIPLHLTPAAS